MLVVLRGRWGFLRGRLLLVVLMLLPLLRWCCRCPLLLPMNLISLRMQVEALRMHVEACGCDWW